MSNCYFCKAELSRKKQTEYSNIRFFHGCNRCNIDFNDYDDMYLAKFIIKNNEIEFSPAVFNSSQMQYFLLRQSLQDCLLFERNKFNSIQIGKFKISNTLTLENFKKRIMKHIKFQYY